MYKNVIFDFYGTLVKIKINEKTDLVWEKLSLYMAYQGAMYGANELKAAYKKTMDKYLARYGGTHYPDVEITDVFYKLYQEKGIKAKSKLLKQTALVYRALTTEKLEVFKGAKEMLKELKKQDKKLFILSNAQRIYLLSELKILGLSEYFDGIYSSSDHHRCKPDPKIYKTLLESENLKKGITIMVGNDYSTDIKGANKAGLDSIYLKSETSNEKSSKEEATYAILDGNYKKIIKVLTTA